MKNAPRCSLLDDIRIGDIQVRRIDPKSLRSAATVKINLVEGNWVEGNWVEGIWNEGEDRPMAGRITIVDDRGVLVPLGARSSIDSAVREGVVYTSTGKASFGVAPGIYKIYAGRGFEYSVASVDIEIESRQSIERSLRLRHEVNTSGWVACDTHMHTLTHSGHVDCTVEERMVTLAGEGVELAIVTDHNKHVDFRPSIVAAGLVSEFASVVGNEFSTKSFLPRRAIYASSQ